MVWYGIALYDMVTPRRKRSHYVYYFWATL